MVIALNFRATASYVTDGPLETYVLADSYPTTRGGYTFGYTGWLPQSQTDRSTSIDRRLAGRHNISTKQSAVERIFRIDVDPGIYAITLAAGDFIGTIDIVEGLLLRDSTGTILAPSFTQFAAPGWVDATGNVRSAAAWPLSQTPVTIAITGTYLELYDNGSYSADMVNGRRVISHLRLDPISPTGSRRRRSAGVPL